MTFRRGRAPSTQRKVIEVTEAVAILPPPPSPLERVASGRLTEEQGRELGDAPTLPVGLQLLTPLHQPGTYGGWGAGSDRSQL